LTEITNSDEVNLIKANAIYNQYSTQFELYQQVHDAFCSAIDPAHQEMLTHQQAAYEAVKEKHAVFKREIRQLLLAHAVGQHLSNVQ
jgi:hypothetical protein